MIVIDRITQVTEHLDGMDAVILDLDDTLYSERDYVRSGFRAACPAQADALWEAFLAGKPAFDTVLGAEEKAAALAVYRAHRPDITLYDGVCDMLCRIRAGGRSIGIITDGRSEGQRAKLDALGLWPMTDAVIITDELGGIEYRKPNETAFRLMAERLRTPFARMVYVGDNPKKDFIAPERLGMRAIWLKNHNGLYRYVRKQIL